MWNPFKKNSANDDDADAKSPKMGMMQAMAMKKMAKMSPQERQKMMQEAMKPENRDKIMGVMSAMKASGQVTDEQIAQAKKMLGM
ncbi:MAG: hypothetical protein Q7T51_03815 [Candidatus Moranbacteria bacterium]|nr:hypothetical protein [Candidatus Moranbacteria bacterium]